jgi:hypothetical protein
MRLLILAAALAVPTASAADYKAPAKQCPVAVNPAGSQVKPGPKRLGELPAGQIVLTVYQEENGCPKPVIVRQGVGVQPRR